MITVEKFREDYLKKLATKSGKPIEETSNWDKYHALASLTREYLTNEWIETNERYNERDVKQVYYFSMEFLTGRFLLRNLQCQNLTEIVREALEGLDFDLDEIASVEKDQGLGNGGLGRLAACFLDSMAALSIPGHGCGIRYKYGLFEQKIVDGYQVEFPDKWLQNRNVWEIKKADRAVEVHFGGNVRMEEYGGKTRFVHENYNTVIAVPYDTPVAGYHNGTVNTLRLWSAESTRRDFDFHSFSSGDYAEAFKQKYDVESISQVLYPNDSYDEGRKLRLKQEYFFVSAGIQGIMNTFKRTEKDLYTLYDYVAIHINDTHPSLAIAEMMRILMDRDGMGWDEAWNITTKVMSYTNHTIMSEALEQWSVDLFKELLPRIYMIVEEINRRFCEELLQKGYGEQKISDMAIISNGMIRMAYLAIVGSYSVNGVAKLHTEILKHRELKNFYELYPSKFNNKTNGITHRRWLLNANPNLAELLDDTIGERWLSDTMELRKMLNYVNDEKILARIDAVKQINKNQLADYIEEELGIIIDRNSIYDVQAKRLHEYKRQTLNILHIMHLYNSLLDNPDLDIPSRTFIFAAKAAPSYHMAKQTIKLINSVADKINNDERVKDKLKVVFLPNYGVSLAEILIPAADISEQISTTTKEASGTGNMKFMMNGAVTIATKDGANIEILNEVGDDNIFIFGLTDDQVYKLYSEQTFDSLSCYESDLRIKRVVDQLVDGTYHDNLDEFRIIRESLLYNDEFFVLEDFNAYVAAQDRIGRAYMDQTRWLKMALTNIACSGIFSSDRTIQEYAAGIWSVDRVMK
ncbi:MAG: glycogen/starch/alpha-glucan phosphorylase [Clostridia bacterium]|nr:glycogen/starch/alpha-glucan phosphorylase [Clostridia bacterium]